MIKEKIITKEELLEKIKNENIEFIPLTFDFIFKGLFMNNLDVLKEFIISQLEFELDPNECTIELCNQELTKGYKKEYKKIVDVYVKINDYIHVNIEVNREYFKNVKSRNIIFADKINSTILETGENMQELENKYFVQININAMEKLNSKKEKLDLGTDKIVLFGLNSKQVYTENKYILVKYIEYYRDLFYNKHNKLSNSEMWLVMLASRNFSELYDTLDYLLDEEDKDKCIRKVIDMCKDKFIIEEWETEKLDALVEATKRYNEKKEQEEKEREKLEFEQEKSELNQEKLELNQEKNEFNQEKNEFNQEKNEFNQEKNEFNQERLEFEKIKKEIEKQRKENENKIKKQEEITKEKSIEIVKNMLKENFDIELISKLTNIQKEEIIKLKKDL